MENNRVFIIAEAGVNHNGDLSLATKLVDAAVKAGADAIKFQTFTAANIVSATAKKADYQLLSTNKSESQFEMLRKLELSRGAHFQLLKHCHSKKIIFLSTPFDIDSLNFLSNEVNIPQIKISSPDLTFGPLLLTAAQTGKPVLLSTGMSTLTEIQDALGVLAFGYLNFNQKFTNQNLDSNNFKEAFKSEEGQLQLKKRVTLLHCTSEYPAPVDEINLRSMDTLKNTFGLSVGFSDHSRGINIPIAAAARGALVIEKHFTLDRDLPGPDHRASLNPDELTKMVQGIRFIERALGHSKKQPTSSEIQNLPTIRRSLVAARPILKGELFSSENLTAKRPGTGESPMNFWEYLGKPAPRSFEKDQQVEL